MAAGAQTWITRCSHCHGTAQTSQKLFYHVTIMFFFMFCIMFYCLYNYSVFRGCQNRSSERVLAQRPLQLGIPFGGDPGCCYVPTG